MNPPNPSLASHRHHRIDAPPASVLPALCHSTPLYVHAGNWMAEMAAITEFTECLIDDSWISFPEQGLGLALPAIQRLHSIAIDHRSSLALEIATHGEPRAVSIAAIPAVSHLKTFADRLDFFPAEPLTENVYHDWRAQHLTRPAACKRCLAAAEERRNDTESHPLTRILSSAVREAIPLHCQLSSSAFRFNRSLIPGNILINHGHLAVTGHDNLSMLEIDTGLCHSLDLHRRRIDDEALTVVTIYNSLGIAELALQTPGFASYENWLQLCKSSS